MINIQKVLFQEVNGFGANPICKMDNYKIEMYKTFPNLQSLDGIKKEYEVLFLSNKRDFKWKMMFLIMILLC